MCVSLFVAFDHYSRSQGQRSVKHDSMHISKTADLTKMNLCMDVTYIESNSCVSVSLGYF